MTPDLKALPAFLAVAETRSFRAAAERLGVTRPAVSQAIGGLEADLGQALFRRTTRSVSLTEAGRRCTAPWRRPWPRSAPRCAPRGTGRRGRAASSASPSPPSPRNSWPGRCWPPTPPPAPACRSTSP
ncbi:LysR family transcriptional regulator [Teichococcus aestuarii]|uniref:LysR family transcriptional regulator n=1 Tax=Teichococcus aestuarii TaxID=568898 RepID=UPI00360ABF46